MPSCRFVLAAVLPGTAAALTAQTTPSFELNRDTYPAPSNPSTFNAVVAGDFNHDGKPDFVTMGGSSETSLFLRLGNGDGTFQPPIEIGAAGNSLITDMAVAHLNDDGKLDLIVVSTATELSGGATGSQKTMTVN